MIKKAIREYLQADAELMSNVNNVFSFFNASISGKFLTLKTLNIISIFYFT